MAKQTETADQAYQRQRARVLGLMVELQRHVEDHAKRQAADPKNWGFAGDLNHYAEQIEEILGSRKYYTTPDGIRMTVPE